MAGNEGLENVFFRHSLQRRINNILLIIIGLWPDPHLRHYTRLQLPEIERHATYANGGAIPIQESFYENSTGTRCR